MVFQVNGEIDEKIGKLGAIEWMRGLDSLG